MDICNCRLPFCDSSEMVVEKREIQRAVPICCPRLIYEGAAGEVKNLLTFSSPIPCIASLSSQPLLPYLADNLGCLVILLCPLHDVVEFVIDHARTAFRWRRR